MMDTLLATLERDADAEIARIRDDARARAAQLTAAAEERMAAHRAATLGRRETEARAQLERALAQTRRAARAQVLAARAELLDRLFAAVRAELPALQQSTAYRERLAPQLRELLRFAGDQPVTITCNPDLTGTLRAAVKTHGRLRIEPDSNAFAGYRLQTANGALEVDATLEGRLERLRPRLALEALAELGT